MPFIIVLLTFDNFLDFINSKIIWKKMSAEEEKNVGESETNIISEIHNDKNLPSKIKLFFQLF